MICDKVWELPALGSRERYLLSLSVMNRKTFPLSFLHFISLAPLHFGSTVYTFPTVSRFIIIHPDDRFHKEFGPREFVISKDL
jgi:hypothetical protein